MNQPGDRLQVYRSGHSVRVWVVALFCWTATCLVNIVIALVG